jgi:hypothetical protein
MIKEPGISEDKSPAYIIGHRNKLKLNKQDNNGYL